MRKRVISIALIFCLSLTFAFSNKYVDLVEDKAAGISFTNAFNEQYSIAGLSYQQWFKNGLGFQVVCGSGDAKFNDPHYAAEFELQKMVYAYKINNFTSALYLWLNTGFCGQTIYSDAIYDEETDSYDSPMIKETINSLGFGVGFGIDLIAFDNFSIPLNIGYIGSYSNKNELLIDLSINAGFRYRF